MQLSGYDSTDQGTLWPGDLGGKRVGRDSPRASLKLFWGRGLYIFLGGGFKYLLFSPLPGEMIQIDYFFKWVETTN